MTNLDRFREQDLDHQLHDRGWNVGKTAWSTQGVTVTFRKGHTSHVPGMETRDVFGKDEYDAVQRLLADLEREDAD